MSRELYSDLHKDAMGFRPRGESFTRAMALSDSDFDAECDSLCEMMGAETDRMRKAQAARVATLIADHGITRADALRWDTDAEGVAA